ncbi:MAG TPA: CPBP family intramembrane glutamic endopeptidase [Lacibacter sp.]|nr:CPBP family intramembrane glutamic endopeptidase [Lacibacter sp.]
MKELFTASWQHIRQSFSILTYGLCFLVISIACWLNYSGVFSLWPEESSFYHSLLFLFLLFFIFFLLGFLFTALQRKAPINFTGNYKWLLLLAPLLFSLKVALPFDEALLQNTSPSFQTAFQKPAGWLGALLFMIPAIGLLHFFFEKKQGLYFIKKSNNFQPYFILLLCMLPLLVAAAVQPAFQEVYPRAKDVTMALGSSASLIHYSLFELSYALDFITIELFFRGLLIAVLSRVLGVHCIIPVALFYFSIHLGKPMQEAISSFFGGLILGAVSYETKSIWGGWLVHCGIALLMELLAFVF